ncbi:hypothetical protein EDE09_12948 [Neorhizobium sp. S3-V5DH]|nr:hypothetical protein EDE09_12948 [Neorhizobium sp. S3-V5DH]
MLGQAYQELLRCIPMALIWAVTLWTNYSMRQFPTRIADQLNGLRDGDAELR